MKLLNTLIPAIILCLLFKPIAAISQIPKALLLQPISETNDSETYYSKPEIHSIFKALPGDTVFYEDFDNGLLGNNGIGTWSIAGPDSTTWMHDYDGSDVSNAPTWAIPGAFTTAANGFMIFDAMGVQANYGDNFAATPIDGSLISPIIDLSATPQVKIQYQSKFNHCCEIGWSPSLDVTTDGFTTFTRK